MQASRRRLLLLFVLALLLCAPSTASAAPDSWCATARSSANTAFSSYVLQEGVGLVGWRSYHNLTLRDRCNHGAITGSISLYDANVRYKRGKAVPQFSYRINNGPWTRAFVHVRSMYVSGGWTSYQVWTDNNIGMVRTSRITHVKVGSYLVFNGIWSSGRRVVCTIGIGCSTGIGL